jgi:hypothetical protein
VVDVELFDRCGRAGGRVIRRLFRLFDTGLEPLHLALKAIVDLGEHALALHEEGHTPHDCQADARHSEDRAQNTGARRERSGLAGHVLIIVP